MKRLIFPLFLVLMFLSGIMIAGAVTYQFGPSGGTGGNWFSDPKDRHLRLTELRVRAGSYIDSIETVYINTQTDAKPASTRHGGQGGNPDVFTLRPHEYIVEVGGKYGEFVNSLWIKTNRGVSRSWGGSGGVVDFSYTAPEGMEINGFFGRAGSYIDCIGVIIRPR